MNPINAILPQKRKQIRKKKNPEAPKHPYNGFMLFTIEVLLYIIYLIDEKRNSSNQ